MALILVSCTTYIETIVGEMVVGELLQARITPIKDTGMIQLWGAKRCGAGCLLHIVSCLLQFCGWTTGEGAGYCDIFEGAS